MVLFVKFIDALGPAIFVGRVADCNMSTLVDCLDNSEKSKASRFRFVADQQMYVAAHSLKRVVLARYIGVHPSSLLFDTEGRGKPFCTYSGAPHFNISHSGGWIVVAVSTDVSVGVDIEVQRRVDTDSIVERIGSEDEIVAYQKSAAPQRHFLCLWTQKEAVSKACGEGISVGLSSIPCSGKIGKYHLSFMGVDYVAYTYLLTNKVTMSFATSAHLPPAIFSVKSPISDKADQLFEFGKFTL